ncbi:MAG: Gfo/Idh/MocA family oxidoreductase [Armatimonadetes bacterium]|nr:Gfo/Idh/MocA family oxidoreductase [Armatimonadota bacterium]
MPPEPLRAVIIGAGHRSVLYASYSKTHPEELQVVGVADPDPVRRERTAQEYALPRERVFLTAEELAREPRFADVAINGTMDRDHVPTTLPLLEAGYHVLLEKPICPTREELLALVDAARRTGTKVMICHVLRFAPFYAAIRERVAAGEIGDLLSVQTVENVSYHHMAVGFVRGKWNRRDKSNPMLMAKCCHDLDLICWMKSGIAPTKVASFGGLTYFRPERAPEGSGTRCLVDCPIERECDYSAYKHYIEQGLWSYYAWECLEHLGTPTMEQKIESLKIDNPYGRCVWRCDNDVVDHQAVAIEFADGSTATHNMIGGVARPCRSMYLIGTRGEIQGTMEEGRFVIRHNDARESHEYTEEVVDLSVSRDMHGGGDLRLVADFLRVVRGEPASLSTTDLMDSVNGHLIAFAADEAMAEARVVAIAEVGRGNG